MKWISIASIFLFVTAVSFTLLFAEGYQVDPASGDLKKMGVIYFESLPEDAHVFVDGEKIDMTILGEVRVMPGFHVLQVQRTGYSPWKQEVFVPEDQVRRFAPITWIGLA